MTVSYIALIVVGIVGFIIWFLWELINAPLIKDFPFSGIAFDSDKSDSFPEDENMEKTASKKTEILDI